MFAVGWQEGAGADWEHHPEGPGDAGRHDGRQRDDGRDVDPGYEGRPDHREGWRDDQAAAGEGANVVSTMDYTCKGSGGWCGCDEVIS